MIDPVEIWPFRTKKDRRLSFDRLPVPFLTECKLVNSSPDRHTEYLPLLLPEVC